MWNGFGKKVVYLAGPINGCSDWEANEWRCLATRLLQNDLVVLDPMSRDFRGKEDDNVIEIVERDKKDILSAQYVLAMALRPSWGTSMEIHFAWTNKIPVYAIVHDGISISPWLRYHSRAVYATLSDACLAIGHDAWERVTGVTCRFEYPTER